MYRVCLINLPFAALEFPSLALTQLKGVVQSELGGQVEIELLYANHEFARLPGYELYQEIATSVGHGLTGLGDWLFRQATFPNLADNQSEYFARCYPLRNEPSTRLRRAVVRLRDQVDTWLDELIERHALDLADLVGMTSMFAQNLACLALARKIKQRRAAVTTVMGGANCEFPMGRELVENFEAIDFVFSGPGLNSFPRFLRHQLQGRPDACHLIDGVLSRHNRSTEPGGAAPSEVSTEQLPVVAPLGSERDINNVVPLDYDDFLTSVARCQRVRPALLFETSRGCWWGERAHCTFCGLNGLTMKYRLMSADNALQQFDALWRYAERLPEVTLQCVDNIMPREYLQHVLPRLRTPANVDIFYEVKSDLTPQEVEVLAQARVMTIQPGIESLATSTLKLMKKGTTAFHGLQLLKNCLRFGIAPQWNLLLGFPGESHEVYEKYQRDLPRLMHLPPPTGAFPVRFDRYSPYSSQAEAYQLDLRPYDFYGLLYPFDPDALQRLAYFFIDNNFQADYFVQMVAWISRIRTQVEQWRSRCVGSDGGEPAMLYSDRTGGEELIIDTRDGTRREHHLARRSSRTLEALQRPLDRNRLSAQLKISQSADLDRELEQLRQWGLLFEEDGRMLSLVMPAAQNSKCSASSTELGRPAQSRASM